MQPVAPPPDGPPIAERRPTPRSLHGIGTIDDYAWLRHRDDPATVEYLTAENLHTEASTAHLGDLRERLFEEIKSRVQETDLSAPAKRGEWWYATRTEEGKQYPTIIRTTLSGSDGGQNGFEQIILDLNAMADSAGSDFLALGTMGVSPDQRLAAYALDFDGGEVFTLRFRDIDSGADLADVIEGVYYGVAWATDNEHCFYTVVDDAHRPHQVWRHHLGTGQDADILVFEETDERMYLSLATTQDDLFVLIEARSRVTADVRYLAAENPTGSFQPIIERVDGVEYSAEHKDGRWLVVTNLDAVNGRLVAVPVEQSDTPPVDLIAHDESRKVVGVLPLANHVVVFGRREGLTSVMVLPDSPAERSRDLVFDEPAYTVGVGRNLEYVTDQVRLNYQSLVTPARVIDVDLVTGDVEVIKETPVLGGFDRSDYVTERLWATASDGVAIPISVVRRTNLTGPAPTLLYGYGSYEAAMDPWFSVARLSLLDRGIVFAVAHIRGGGEMGRGWYESGKMDRKVTTFTDFIACAEYLIDVGVTAPDRLAARGGSAGGLLMGAIANMRPDLFRAIVAEVPFVDVINTMLDPTIPLTVIEWEEWGNPTIEEQHVWMLDYSPYDNVADVEYPSMLVTAGLNDPRVAFWEPAKWVARMRAVATHRGPLLLKTEMGSGHGGPSGRYDAWRDEAFVLAYLLDQLGVGDAD